MFFVVPGSGPASLGMPNIDNLHLLTIKYETTGRQLTSDDNTDNRKRNCQYERAVQTGSGMTESCTNKK